MTRALALTLALLSAPLLAADPITIELKIVPVVDAPKEEYLLVFGDVAFRTVAGLRRAVAAQPDGTVIRLAPGCVRSGKEPLISSEDELRDFQQFCASEKVELVVVPSG